jgi:ATP-binding cassette, subfamily B, bacterial
VLEVRGLASRTATGRSDALVDLTIRRGEFVVVTGPVGAGKSTLLRALLGLAWQAEVVGSVRWNGVEIDDRAAFLVPPNAAFLSQVPQLISDSVGRQRRPRAGRPRSDRNGIAAGRDHRRHRRDARWRRHADRSARGLRLSGGQRQRLATARALVHSPELVVLDDLSSALDVETEVQLWTNLADAGMTVIAVSHRAVAFDRADQVLRLDRGRLSS